MLCGLADALDALRAARLPVDRVLLIGGAAASAAVQAIAPDLFGVPVRVPSPGEYVALGAARQAAWALSGGEHPPAWHVETDVTVEPEDVDPRRCRDPGPVRPRSSPPPTPRPPDLAAAHSSRGGDDPETVLYESPRRFASSRCPRSTRPGAVRLPILQNGVCGTDLHLRTGRAPRPRRWRGDDLSSTPRERPPWRRCSAPTRNGGTCVFYEVVTVP